ncbi:MAG: hypothetical protein WCI17_01525 [bacterium]
MDITPEIIEESADCLPEYARIPISFEVRLIFGSLGHSGVAAVSGERHRRLFDRSGDFVGPESPLPDAYD